VNWRGLPPDSDFVLASGQAHHLCSASSAIDIGDLPSSFQTCRPPFRLTAATFSPFSSSFSVRLLVFLFMLLSCSRLRRLARPLPLRRIYMTRFRCFFPLVAPLPSLLSPPCALFSFSSSSSLSSAFSLSLSPSLPSPSAFSFGLRRRSLRPLCPPTSLRRVHVARYDVIGP